MPNELRDAADNFELQGWLWWRKVILPGIFPYYVTGAITASGGAWNASIVAEVVSWGDTTLQRPWPGRLYRRRHDGGRLSARRAGHRRDVRFVVAGQPHPVAAALPVRRTPIPAGLRRWRRMDAAPDRPVAGRRRPCPPAPSQGGGENLLVLDDVNLTLKEGEIVGLLGRSGSGKSTLLRLIAGLMPASDGEVVYRAAPWQGPAARRRHGVPELRPVSLADGAGERASWAWRRWACRRRAPQARAGGHRPDRARRLRKRLSRRNCPAACASASASPAPWWCIPRSC